MPIQNVTPNASGSIGPLAVPNLFSVTSGTVLFSTDGGATYRPFGIGGTFRDYIFPAVTVNWKGDGLSSASFTYMPG